VLATSEAKQSAKTINAECSFLLSLFSVQFFAQFASSETKKFRRKQKLKSETVKL